MQKFNGVWQRRPVSGSSVILSGMYSKKERHLKRNKNGFEDFREYFEETMEKTMEETNPDLYYSDCEDMEASISCDEQNCSPLRLSFNNGNTSSLSERLPDVTSTVVTDDGVTVTNTAGTGATGRTSHHVTTSEDMHVTDTGPATGTGIIGAMVTDNGITITSTAGTGETGRTSHHVTTGEDMHVTDTGPATGTNVSCRDITGTDVVSSADTSDSDISSNDGCDGNEGEALAVLQDVSNSQTQHKSSPVSKKPHRKRRKKMIYTRRKRSPQKLLGSAESITIGSKKYHRLPINTPSANTPGVRRSRRKRTQPLAPGEYIEYQHHWGSSPSQQMGAEAKYILKPVPVPKQKTTTTEGTASKETDDYLNIVDNDKGEEIRQRIVTPLSSIACSNIQGKVSCQRYMNTDTFSCGHITIKPRSEKPTARTGDNLFVFHALKGTTTLTIADHSFTIKPKCWFTVPPNTVYSIKNDKATTVDLLYIITSA